ncbi:MAG TPA: hypothetical protein VGE22_12285 [Solimonas sp.]
MLTISDYARSRKARELSGGTKQAVHKAITEGRISAFGPDKLIDPALADMQWERNTRARVTTGAPAPAGQSGRQADNDRPDLPELAAAAATVGAAPAEPPQQLHGDPGYLKSRAAQAEADARIAQMKAAELEGQLVRVDQVRAQLATQLAPVREALLQLPARLASLLAAEGDPGRVQTMLEAEIHQVLAPLGTSSAAAEGAA